MATDETSAAAPPGPAGAPSGLAALISAHAGPGRVVWIGLRPGRRLPVLAVGEAEILQEGLAGDRIAAARGTSPPGGSARRAVTLIQAEHLAAIRALARAPWAGFADLRRNVAVAGLPLAGMRGRRLRLGTAVLEVTGPCAPCSRMEEALGHGGYAAMRGHGGVTARVIAPGRVALGDPVLPA